MKPKSRILIFSLVYYPRFIGGAEVTIKEVTDRIPVSDIEFDMVTLRLDSTLPKFERVGNVNVHRVGWAMNHKASPDSLPWYLGLNKYAFLVTGLVKALMLHKKNKYHATWSLMVTYNSFAAVFFKLIHKKVPFILTLQDGDPIAYITRRAMPLYPFFKMMFTRANYIQAISKYLAVWASDMGATCPIKVVPNAVDVALFSRVIDERIKKDLSQKYGKKDGDVFLVTTSRLVVKNAVGDIIEALALLPKNYKLLILGQGYQETELKQQALRLGLNYTDEPPVNVGNRVHFVGYVAHKDMPPYLSISDIFIRPSLSEGLGNSFLEAMAASIPVIATPVGGIPDFLKEGETGLFCEVGKPRSIALKVEKLSKDAESRSYIVRQAKKMVEERYEWGRIAGEMKTIFESVVN